MVVVAVVVAVGVLVEERGVGMGVGVVLGQMEDDADRAEGCRDAGRERGGRSPRAIATRAPTNGAAAKIEAVRAAPSARCAAR